MESLRATPTLESSLWMRRDLKPRILNVSQSVNISGTSCIPKEKKQMPIHRNRSNTVLIGIIVGVGSLFGVGCGGGHMYMATARNYPNCVTQAQISPAKANACMDSSDKASFNDCLLSKKVPQSKIDVLNACIDSHRRSSIGNLF